MPLIGSKVDVAGTSTFRPEHAESGSGDGFKVAVGAAPNWVDVAGATVTAEKVFVGSTLLDRLDVQAESKSSISPLIANR